MAIPNNGLANSLAIQRETTFAAASAEPVYSVPGKIQFTQSPVLSGAKRKVNVWREDTADSFTAKFWRCSLEMEFGFNLVTNLLLQTFFEAVGSSAAGGYTTYTFRPMRLTVPQSLKLGLDYNPGGPYLSYKGVVIDSLSINVRLRQPPKLRIEFKAVDITTGGSPAVLGAPTAVTKNLGNHTGVTVALGGVAHSNITDLTFNFKGEKTPTRFGEDNLPTVFALEPVGFGGEFAEYFNPDSTMPTLVRNRTETDLAFTMTDPAQSNRVLSITWPRILFSEGTPDGIRREDTNYRANFYGLLSLAAVAPISFKIDT